MKINYKLKMDKEINRIKASGRKPTLLLHACCAPCSSAVLELLNEVFDITIYFYNPNISPESEFVFRLEELKRLVSEMKLENVEVIAPDYDSSEFIKMAKGLEGEHEGGERCKKCYRLRLEKSVAYAKEKAYDYVTTTLSISPHKNSQWLNEIGIELGEQFGIKYLYSDFKKGEGYKRSLELSKEFGLYRQNYCGCIYSKKSAD